MDQTQFGGQSSAPSQSVNPRKLFVGNLSWSLSSEDLRQMFAEFGDVEEALVLTDKFTQRSKGFGFVTMATEEAAQAAIDGLNNQDVGGRQIVVNVAQPPRPREDRGGSRGGFGGGRGGDRGGYRGGNGGGRSSGGYGSSSGGRSSYGGGRRGE